MAKGTVAKETLTKLITDALGDAFVGIQDKKIYCNMNDGNEMVQVAISMTVPKTPISAVPAGGGEGFSSGAPTAITPVEMSDADKAKVADLMAKLGVTPSGS